VFDITEYVKCIEFMAKGKKKMGRPPIKAKDRRTALVTLRLKESDHKELEKNAKAKGLSLSSYLLECWQKVRK
jgi:predicted HicB family RNase H-like nuclease